MDEITRLRAKRDKLENTLDNDDGSMSEAKEMLLRQQLVAVENQIASLLAQGGGGAPAATMIERTPPSSSSSSGPAGGGAINVHQNVGQNGLPDLCPWRLLDCFGASSQGENITALQHLVTVIQNLLKFPQQDRYQSLRMGNERLQRELFHVRLGDAAMMMPQVPEDQRAESAAEAFLLGIGFRRELRPIAQAQKPTTAADEFESEAEPWLVFTLAPPTSPSSESHIRLTSALQDIEEIRKRDTDTQRNSAEFQTWRKSVVMDIRMDRLRQAMDAGEGETLCEMLMLGEGGPAEVTHGRPLSSSTTTAELDEEELSDTLDNIQTLRRVFQNIVDAPHDERYRTLKLGNKLVHRTLMTQRGGLEFILGVGGFVQRGDDGSMVLEGNALVATETCANALTCLERIERAVSIKLSTARDRARMLAIESARAEVEAEVEKTRRAKRHQEKLAAMAERQQNGGGARIKLEDAVKFLLGAAEPSSAAPAR
ncbi:Hypothetical protein, putative [Bodo saltans]|uniref:PUB domain-containing protein n=1 Tax=Bodo saltans TaxID=75058 RepID=A0A0S4IK53_BODSA|nr:Hypothetical protein, putative [Bodo saltans]|eukprot:CUE62923.1 Hypothetical protein, putative [Bodo saltans]